MSLPHLLMGILNLEPLTGYDLNKHFELGPQNFWTVSQSQIYRALHRMEEDGWVTVEMIVQEGSPNKKIYRLTDTGHAELKKWLVKPLTDGKAWLPKMGQVFFGDAVARDEELQLLKTYVAYHETIYAELRIWYDSLQADLDNPDLPQRLLFRIAPLERAMLHAQFEIEWYTKMMQRVESNQNPENKDIEKWHDED